MALVPCSKCRRHIRVQMSGCPFCGAVNGLASMAAAASLVVAACGPTASPPTQTPAPVSAPTTSPEPVPEPTPEEIDGGGQLVQPAPEAAPDAGEAPPVLVEEGNGRPRPQPTPTPAPPPRRPREPEAQPLYGVDYER
jgi:hypothetical protein